MSLKKKLILFSKNLKIPVNSTKCFKNWQLLSGTVFNFFSNLNLIYNGLGHDILHKSELYS